MKLRSCLFILALLSVALLVFPSVAHAQRLLPGDILGRVSPPPGVQNYNDLAGTGGTGQGIGIIIFASNMLKIATIVAGLLVFLNLILAGFNYITAGEDAGTLKKVQESVKNSVIGLFLIVAAYTITAVISLAIFGDPSYILNPQIEGPAAPAGFTP